MRTFLRLKFLFLFFLSLAGGQLFATPACPIITQSFQNSANGATVDPSATGWYLDASKLTNPVYFAVLSNRLKAENLGAEGIWYSRVFSVAGYSSFQAAVKITAEGLQNNSEYVKVSYKIDGGPETLLAKDSGNFGTIDFTSGTLTGSNIQLIVRIYDYNNGSSQTSKYYIEQYRVFKETGPCALSSIAVAASASNGGVLTCASPSTTLSASTTATGATTWSWAGPNGFTSTAQNPAVSTAGTYTVTGTNAAGSGSANVTITSNTTLPDLTATGGALACASSITINASSSVSGATYKWTGPNGFTSTSNNPSVTAAGTYTVTVTNPANGCMASQSVSVTAGTAGSSTLWLEDFTLPNGTTVDNGTTSWSVSHAGTGTFSVQNNEFKASFASTNEGVWTSGVINIAGKTNVVISADLRSMVDAGKALESTDHILVLYKLNGGAETLIYGDSAGLGNSTTGTATKSITSLPLSGNTLQIVIRAENSDTTEHYYFDNIKVVGASATVSVTPAVTGTVTCSSTAQLSATVTGGTATAWSWTGPNGFTSAIQNPTVSAGGQYTVTATLSGGCTLSAPVTVTANKTAPDISATGGTFACLPTVTLNVNSSVPGATYSWTGPNSFTSAAKNPAVSAAGTYIATVTNPANGCTASQSVVVSPQPASSLWFQDFTAANGTTAATGVNSWSSSTSPASSVFSVQNNEFKVSGMGSTGEGVWTSGVISITGKTNVSISAKERCAFTGSSGGMNSSGTLEDYLRFYYKLNNGPEVLFNEKLGAISNYSTVNTPLSFTGLSGTSLQIVVRARATGTDEFYFFDSVKVTASGVDTFNVNASATGVLTCSNAAVTLSGVSSITGATYNWSGPNAFTSTVQNPSVGTPGVYTLTVTNPATGCSASDTANVIQNNTGLVTIASANSILTCKDTVATLTGSSTGSRLNYKWTGPNSFTSALQNPVVKKAGVYTLVATDSATGCTGTDTASLAQNILAPVVTASAQGQITCKNPVLPLTGSFTPATGASFGWTGPNGFTSSVQNPSVTIPGIYTLTATITATGCTGSDTANAILNNTPPGISASVSGTLNCRDTVVTLSGSSPAAGVTFAWTGPNGFTSTVQNPVVKSGGLYTLTVTGPSNGCSSSTTATVTQDTAHPANVTASVTSAVTQLNCTNNNVFLQGSIAPAGTTYGWTGPNGFSFAANSTIVLNPGLYTYTVTNGSNFCSASASVNVVRDITPPANFTAAPSLSLLTCTQPSVTVVASSSTPGNYNWTGPNSFTSSADSVRLSAPGVYNVTLTNPVNGCTITTAVTVSQNTTPPANVLAGTSSGSTFLTCSSPTLGLLASSSTGGVTYNWTGPNGFSATTATASASVPGTYTLTVVNPVNGCATTASIALQKNTTPPLNIATVATPPSGTLTCATPSVLLTGTSATTTVKYGWNGPNGYSASGQSISTVIAGNYVLTVTDTTNGCSDTTIAVVSQNTVTPIGVSAFVDQQLTCSVTNANLSASSSSSSVNYSWTGPGGFTATTANTHTSTPGLYTVTVVSTLNGCTKSAQLVVSQNIAPPANVTAANSGPLTCDNSEVTLTGSSSSPNVEYEWDGPDGYLSFSPQDVASEAGDYVLTVTNDDNGCTASQTTTVVLNCNNGRVATGTVVLAPDSAAAPAAFTFKAWPNPFSDKAFVEFQSPETAFITIQVYNNNGVVEKLLFNSKAVAGQLYKLALTDRLPSGVHYVVVRVNNKIYTRQLIAVH